MIWARKEARPRIRRKKYTLDTWEKKNRKTEGETDGLCQPRHERYQHNKRRMYEFHLRPRGPKDEVRDRTGWGRIVSAAATGTIKLERLEEEG